MRRKNWIHLSIIFSLSFLLLGCASTGVRDEERPLLITIEEIDAQGVEVGTPTQEGEKYAARRYINGTTEVEYEYDSERDSANDVLVIFFSEADTLRNESLAITAFHDAIEAYEFGTMIGNSNIEVVEVPDHFTLGDQNFSAYLEVNGIKFGNLVVTRKGNMVYSLMLAGPYIKYSKTLHNLIGPKLEMVNE